MADSFPLIGNRQYYKSGAYENPVTAIDTQSGQIFRDAIDTLSAQTVKVIEDKKDQPSLEEAQEFVGGWVERVQLKNGDVMLIDEEGKLKEKDINQKATHHWVESYGMNDVIVGDVILIKKEALTDKWLFNWGVLLPFF